MGKPKPKEPAQKSKAGDKGKDSSKGDGKGDKKGGQKSGSKQHYYYNEDDPDYTKPKGCQKIVVRHILCEKRDRLEEARSKIESGAKFDDVAREFSEDKAKHGGMLNSGGILRGDLHPEFANFAFDDLPESTCAKPRINKKDIFTKGDDYKGYHLMMIEKRT